MKEGGCRIGRSLTTVATGMSIEFSLVYSAGIVAVEGEGERMCVCVCACVQVCQSLHHKVDTSTYSEG